jgi:hypothetical protein
VVVTIVCQNVTWHKRKSVYLDYLKTDSIQLIFVFRGITSESVCEFRDRLSGSFCSITVIKKHRRSMLVPCRISLAMGRSLLVLRQLLNNCESPLDETSDHFLNGKHIS